MRNFVILTLSWLILRSELGLFSRAEACQSVAVDAQRNVAGEQAFKLACQGKLDEAKAILGSPGDVDVDLQMAMLAIRLWHAEHQEQALLAGSSERSGKYSIAVGRLFRRMNTNLDEAQWRHRDTRLSMWIAGSLVPRSAGNGWRYLRLSELEQSRGMRVPALKIMNITAHKLGRLTSRKAYEDSPEFDTLRRYQMLAAQYIANGEPARAADIISQIAETTGLVDAVASFRYVDAHSRQSALLVLDSMKNAADYDEFKASSIRAMEHPLPISQGSWTSTTMSSILLRMFRAIDEPTRNQRADLVDPELAAVLLDPEKLASLAQQYFEREAENELAVLLYDCDENFCPRELLLKLLDAKAEPLRALAVEKLVERHAASDKKVIECLVQLANCEDPSVRYAGLALFAKSQFPAPDSIRNSHHEKDDGDTDRLLRLLSGDTISPSFVTDVCSSDNSWIQSMVVRRALEEHEDPALQNSCIGSLAEHGTDYAVIVGAESLKSINQDFGALNKRLLLCSESQSSDEIRRRAQELLSGRKR